MGQGTKQSATLTERKSKRHQNAKKKGPQTLKKARVVKREIKILYNPFILFGVPPVGKARRKSGMLRMKVDKKEGAVVNQMIRAKRGTKIQGETI